MGRANLPVSMKLDGISASSKRRGSKVRYGKIALIEQYSATALVDWHPRLTVLRARGYVAAGPDIKAETSPDLLRPSYCIGRYVE